MAGSLRRAASTAPNATRFATAVVLVPLAVVPALLGDEWFVGLVVGVAAAAAWELTTLHARAGLPSVPMLAVLVAVAFPLANAFAPFPLGWLLMAGAFGAALLVLGHTLSSKSRLGAWALCLGAGLYPGVLLAPAILLRERADGLGWILLVLLATWACDSAAFFIGRRWGRRKLAPSVSPSKTVEGLLGGLMGGVLVGALASVFLAGPPVRPIGLGFVVAVAAILGDLAESAMKRQLGAKDSGWLVPGHGGLLDRVDSLLFTSFLGYCYVVLTDGVLNA